MKKVAITKTDDTVESYDFINAFSLNNREYVILSKNEKKAVDTAEYNVAYVSEIVKENDQISLVGITEDNEWDAVKNAMADMSKGAKTGINFNYEGKIILKGNKKMALPEKSFTSLIAPDVPEVAVEAPAMETPVAPTFEVPAAPAVEPAPAVETPVMNEPNMFDNISPVTEVMVEPAAPVVEAPVAPTFEVPAEPVVEPAPKVEANIFDNPAVEAPVTAQANMFDTPNVPTFETQSAAQANIFDTPTMEAPAAPQTNMFDTPAMPMVEEKAMPEFKVPTMENMAAPEAKTVIEPQPIINEISSPVFPEYNMFDTPEAAVTKEPDLSAPEYQASNKGNGIEELKALREEISRLTQRLDEIESKYSEENTVTRVA